MPTRAVMLFRLSAVSAAIVLASCGQGSIANDRIEMNDADPALTSVLEDAILTDPGLSQQSNRNSVRPPELPTRAEYPAMTAMPRRAAAQGGAIRPAAPRAGGSCGAAAEFHTGMEWAERLPAAFPPYPGGRVTEAAGQQSGDCQVRVVTFRTGDDYRRIIDWYTARATAAGYSAEHQVRGRDHVLGGAKQGTNGAFYLVVSPAEGGSDVSLIVNNGR